MRLGLVVSVKRYDDEDVVDLKNTADDASKLRGFIAEALPKGRRFDVEYLSDPTASDVYLALKSIKKKLLEAEKKAKKEGRQEKHLFLFFFGGHGYARPDGTQYLLCSDAVNVERSSAMIGGIEPVVLQEFAEGLESTDVVFWIDACRGQVFRQKGDERYSLDKFRTVCDVPSGEAPSSARRLTINACDHNQYAADDGLAMSLAVKLMRDALDDGKDVLLDSTFTETWGELLNAERKGKSPQTPVASGRPILLAPGKTFKKPEIKPTPKEEAEPVREEPKNEPSHEMSSDAPPGKSATVLRRKRWNKKTLGALVGGAAAALLLTCVFFPREVDLPNVDPSNDNLLKSESSNVDLPSVDPSNDNLLKSESSNVDPLNDNLLKSESSDVDPLNDNLLKSESSNVDLPNVEIVEDCSQFIPGSRATLTYKGVEFAFRYCPAGSFTMGSPSSESGRDDDEDQRSVTIEEGFWICETETTQEQWDTVGVKKEKECFNKGSKLPVERVSWNDYDAFIKKLNELGVAPKGWRFVLPTEEQWEYACRAGTTGSTYGVPLDEAAWYFSNSEFKTHEVGTKKPNKWGIFDMLGNVWEWTSSKYDDGSSFVNRGGSWRSYGALRCRPANRSYNSPTDVDDVLGARAALVRQPSK